MMLCVVGATQYAAFRISALTFETTLDIFTWFLIGQFVGVIASYNLLRRIFGLDRLWAILLPLGFLITISLAIEFAPLRRWGIANLLMLDIPMF